MAKIGLKMMAWAPVATEPSGAIPTYGPGKIIGRAVSTNLSVTNAEGELFADDALAEFVSEFASAQWTAEVDHISLEDQAALYGAVYTQDGELQHFGEDVSPYGGIGGYQVLMHRNVRKYRAWFFPKGKASIPDESNATRGGSISFGTQPMNLRILAPDFGPWKYVRDFTTEAAAKAYVEQKLNVAAWHSVAVQVQGADGTTKAVAPSGAQYVADGGTLELTVTGTPTAMYDNGADVLASVTGGKYTLANVAADHAIAVIF